ncbi:MAG: MFS transporter [Actinomycetota bacterium]|nr:MFS transporter [Actinomycetota bacterium]
MVTLLRNRDFRLLLAGQTLSMFGDIALFIVLAIWVKQLTGSNGEAGAVFLALALPSLASPLGGLIVDRHPRRIVMIADDILTGLMVLLLLLVHGRSDVWLIFVVAFLYGTSMTVFFAARSGLLFSMLDEDHLGEANGVLESLRQGLRVGGPLAGAALFALWGGGAVALIDSATFFVSAGCLLALRVTDLERTTEHPPLLEEISAGARHLWRIPELRRLVIILAVALCTIGMLEAAFFALVDNGLHRPPEFVGVIGAVQGVGSILGGICAAGIMRRIGESKLAGLGLAVGGGGLAVIVAGTLIPALSGALLVGVGLSWLLVGYVTLLQRRTPAQLQGRVFSAAEALLAAPQTLSIGLGAALVTFLGFRVIYGVNGAVLLMCGWLLFRSPVTAGDRGEDSVADVPPSPTAGVPPLPLEPVGLDGGAYDRATSSSRSSPQ